jgi:hypothetical protein
MQRHRARTALTFHYLRLALRSQLIFRTPSPEHFMKTTGNSDPFMVARPVVFALSSFAYVPRNANPILPSRI